jgi:hypothetical protein
LLVQRDLPLIKGLNRLAEDKDISYT